MRGTLKQIQQKCRPDKDIGYSKFMAEGDICETYKKTRLCIKTYMAKNFIKQSHTLYLQSDMKTYITTTVDIKENSTHMQWMIV